MERKNPRKSPVAGGPPAKVSRKRAKNGLSKIKEEKHPVGGPDPGGGNSGNGPGSVGGPCGPPGSQYDAQSMDGSSLPPPSGSKGLSDDLLMNGGDIKLENPSTPHQQNECPPDIPPLSELGHDFPPDCKPPMNYNCYPPHYNNNMPPSNMSMPPGDFGPPPHPHHPHGPHGQVCGPGGGMGGMNYQQGPPPPPPHSMPPQMSQQQQQQPPPPPTKSQASTLEAQYMQQQSQIFVFSTKLANKAAEAVFQQQFPSIIAFHMAQPATRKFLEKNPFKLNNNLVRQFQGNPNWSGPPGGPPPPQAKMGKGSKGGGGGGGGGGPPPMQSNMPPDFNPMHPGQGGAGPQWNTHNSPKPQQPGYPNYYDGPGGPYGGPCQQGPPGGPCQQGPPGGPMGPCPPGGGPPPPPGYFGGHPNHGPQGPMPPGVKVPDENLTPQQRMHREEQLAKLNRMKASLFPENHDGHPGHGGDANNCHPGPPHENLDAYNMSGEPPPGGPMGPMDYMSNMGPGGGGKPQGNEWSSPPGGFFMDGNSGGMKPSGGPGQPLPPPGMGPQGNGRPGKVGGGSIPSPATPLTPSSSCGGPPRPSPHSPMSGGDPMYPGNHSFYPSSGYFSPQVGPGQENSPNATVQRKDSESSNSEGGKSRKEKSSCSISPTSSAPPSVKEANLMPVPSPQQIQYLNVFEGQELTIQKQPNVGLTDHANDSSPGMPPSSMDMNPSTPMGKPSHSAPPTPVSMPSARPGSVGPNTPKNNSTTPNPSPRGMDSTSQPGTPLTMNLDGIKNSSGGNTPSLSNNQNSMGNFGPGGMGNGPHQQPPSSCNMMNKQGLPPIALDGHPDGPGGPVFDNVPLNPNLAGPGPPGKPAFDPISSMVQMSQQLTGGNGTPPNSSSNSSGHYGGGGGGMNPPPPGLMNPSMVNFNTSMHSVQNVEGGVAMGGPQTVNNTYVNATMTIQQMNIQNIPPYMNPGQNMGPMGHQMGSHMGNQMGPMGQGMGHMPPIGGGPMGGPNNNMGGQMGPGGPGGPMGGPGGHMGGPGGPMGGPGGPMGGPGGPMGGPGGPMGGPGGPMGGPGGPMGGQGGPMGGPGGPGGPMGGQGGPMGGQGGPMGQMGGMGPMGCGSGPMSMPSRMGYGNQGPPRMGPGGPGPQGQVRPGPYRMPNNPGPGGPGGPPRPFGGTNIQVKPNAPNTIQYLPARPPPPHNQGGPGSGMCSPSMGGPGPAGRTGPNLDFLQRYTNPSSGPVVNVNMGMSVSVGNMGNRMQYPPGPPQGPGGMGNNGPMGGGGPMGNNGPPHNMGGPMRGPPPPHQMMDQSGGQMGGQSMPPQMMGGPNGGMKGPPQGYPGGPPNGPSGQGGPQPPPSDPAYAQQFHHFQQQLYATGSNNGRNPMQQNPNNPNTPPNQSFFTF